jgi:hypothetical protein
MFEAEHFLYFTSLKQGSNIRVCKDVGACFIYVRIVLASYYDSNMSVWCVLHYHYYRTIVLHSMGA